MILVTGGTGLVGSHLLLELVKQGQPVRALCRNTSSKKDVEALFDFYQAKNLYKHVQWVIGDVLDYFSLVEVLKEVTVVYHCAAMVSFKPSDRAEMFEINVEGTANLVNACIDKHIAKFCFVSSIATLGKSMDDGMIDETCYWQNDDNHSVYSQSKFRAEMEVWRGTKEGLNAIIVNPSVIIGAGNKQRSTGQLLQKVAKGMRFYTAGATGFVAVDDVVTAMITLTQGPTTNERYIINGENLSYLQFLSLVAKAFGVKAPHINATRVMTSLAWRLERLRYYLTGKAPSFTKETARTSQNKSRYSSAKVQQAIDLIPTPIEQAVWSSVKYLNEVG